jgi:hypothetical protein
MTSQRYILTLKEAREAGVLTLLNSDLEKLGLPKRNCDILKSRGFKKVHQLLSCTIDEINAGNPASGPGKLMALPIARHVCRTYPPLNLELLYAEDLKEKLESPTETKLPTLEELQQKKQKLLADLEYTEWAINHYDDIKRGIASYQT